MATLPSVRLLTAVRPLTGDDPLVYPYNEVKRTRGDSAVANTSRREDASQSETRRSRASDRVGKYRISYNNNNNNNNILSDPLHKMNVGSNNMNIASPTPDPVVETMAKKPKRRKKAQPAPFIPVSVLKEKERNEQYLADLKKIRPFVRPLHGDDAYAEEIKRIEKIRKGSRSSSPLFPSPSDKKKVARKQSPLTTDGIVIQDVTAELATDSDQKTLSKTVVEVDTTKPLPSLVSSFSSKMTAHDEFTCSGPHDDREAVGSPAHHHLTREEWKSGAIPEPVFAYDGLRDPNLQGYYLRSRNARKALVSHGVITTDGQPINMHHVGGKIWLSEKQHRERERRKEEADTKAKADEILFLDRSRGQRSLGATCSTSPSGAEDASNVTVRQVASSQEVRRKRRLLRVHEGELEGTVPTRSDSSKQISRTRNHSREELHQLLHQQERERARKAERLALKRLNAQHALRLSELLQSGACDKYM